MDDSAELQARVNDVEVMVGRAVDWIGQMTLWAAVASMLLGGCVWGLGNLTGNGDGGRLGRRLLIAGFVGASLVPIAPALVNALNAA